MTTWPAGRRWIGTLLVASTVLSGCAPKPSQTAAAAREDLALLAGWMTGTFRCEGADEDPQRRVERIWAERTDGYWLLERPEGHVYQLVHLSLEIFELRAFLSDAELELGVLATSSPETGPQALTRRAGCELLLRKTERNTFEGSVLGRLCKSRREGAVYATTEVVVESDRTTRWDRDWDAERHQVWGPRDGPLTFEKTSDQPSGAVPGTAPSPQERD